MLGAGGNEVSDPPAVREFSARSLRHTLAVHTSHRLLRVPPIRLLPLPESRPIPMRTGKTHRLKTCATGCSEGLPVPGSRRCSGTDPPQADWSAQPWMAERSQHRASEAQDGRSERPATGMGSPEPRERLGITCDSCQTALATLLRLRVRRPRSRSCGGCSSEHLRRGRSVRLR